MKPSKDTSQAKGNAGQPPARDALTIAVGIATRGRAAVLLDTLEDLRLQKRSADRLLVCYAEPQDIGDGPARFPEVEFLQAQAGLTRQRNAILQQLCQEDLVVFLDDDFYLHADYLRCLENVFSAQPGIAVATGKVLGDGILGPGLTLADAKRTIAGHSLTRHSEVVETVFNAYGCNMALRLALIRQHGLRFDETLPLYGWYEDVDFSRQMARFGGVVQVQACCGVHLGVKSGRQAGVRLGYSQIANPVYLARKGSVSWVYALASMMSRSLKNVVMSLRPEPFVDRRGRLRGNVRAWGELLRGTITPTRILHL